MEQTPDTSEAQTIEVADGQTLSITEEGTYILQGTASDCTVLVNAPEAKVQLILDNVTVIRDIYGRYRERCQDRCRDLLKVRSDVERERDAHDQLD